MNISKTNKLFLLCIDFIVTGSGLSKYLDGMLIDYLVR